MLNQLIKKVCSRCKIEKPLKDFYQERKKRARGRIIIVYRSSCRKCDSKRAIIYQNAHLERTLEIRKKAMAKFKALHPDYDRLRIKKNKQYNKRMCNECRRKFTSDLMQIMFVNGHYLRICPLCALKIRNETTKALENSPFAQEMYKRALAEVKAYRER